MPKIRKFLQIRQIHKWFCVVFVVVGATKGSFYGGTGGGIDIGSEANVAVVAVENGRFLSHLQRLVIVKMRRREALHIPRLQHSVTDMRSEWVTFWKNIL